MSVHFNVLVFQVCPVSFYISKVLHLSLQSVSYFEDYRWNSLSCVVANTFHLKFVSNIRRFILLRWLSWTYGTLISYLLVFFRIKEFQSLAWNTCECHWLKCLPMLLWELLSRIFGSRKYTYTLPWFHSAACFEHTCYHICF